MDIKDIPDKGKDLVNKATKAFKGKASEVTEDVIRTTVNQTLNIIQVAAEEIRDSCLPVENATLNAVVDIGLVHLSIQVNVVPKGDEIKVIAETGSFDLSLCETQLASTNGSRN